jgi:MFS family permease
VFEEKGLTKGKHKTISETKYCKNPELYQIREDQFQSVVLKNGLYCDKQSEAALGVMLIFLIGGVVGAGIMFFSDTIGRNPTFNIGLVFIAIGFFLALYIDKFYWIVVGYSLAMGGSDCVFSLAFIHLNESLGTKLRLISNTLMFSAFSIGEIVFNGGKFFFFNTYEDLLLFNLACGLFTFIPALYVLESPMYLKEDSKRADRLYSWIMCAAKRTNSSESEI